MRLDKQVCDVLQGAIVVCLDLLQRHDVIAERDSLHARRTLKRPFVWNEKLSLLERLMMRSSKELRNVQSC